VTNKTPKTSTGSVQGPAHPGGKEPKGNPFGGYRKKCYRLGEFLRDLGALLPRTTDIWGIWRHRRVDPLFREEIMVAVARTNECRLCTYVHTEWALSAGLPEGDRGEVSRPQPSGSDPGKGLALSYAESLASSDFQQVPEGLRREVSNVYGATRCRDIETIARAMTVFNRSFNTVEALFSRMKGQPSGHSRLLDELPIGVAFALLYPVVILMVSLLRRRSPIAVLRGFLASRSDMHSTEDPAQGKQERAGYDGHFGKGR
jgi:AhpD family alkylhydroperoxidase